MKILERRYFLDWARAQRQVFVAVFGQSRQMTALANFWSRVGNQAQAAALLDAALREHPRSLLLLIDRAGVACSQGVAPPGLRAALLRAAATAELGSRVVQYQLQRLLDGLSGCTALGPDMRGELVAAALSSPQALAPQVRRELLHEQALIALGHGDAATAYALDLRALRLPGLPPGVRLRLAAELGGAGHPRLALRLLDAVPSPLVRIHGWSMGTLNQLWLRHVGFYRDSELHMRRALRRQIAARDGAPSAPREARRTLMPQPGAPRARGATTDGEGP